MYYGMRHPADNIDLDLYENKSKEIKEELELIKKYFDDYESLSLEEMYTILSRFFNFGFDDKDIFEIARRFCNNPNRFVDLASTIETWVARQDLSKKGFNIIEDKVREHYVCAANEAFKEEDKKYTSQELIELTTKHLITPLYKYNEVIDEYSRNREKPVKVNTLEDVGIKFKGVHDDFSVFELEFNHYAEKYLHCLFCDENFNRIKEDIDRDLIDYVDRLNNYIDNFHNFDEEKETVKKYSRELKQKNRVE